MAVRKRTWTTGGEKRESWVCEYFAVSPRTGENKRHLKTFKTQREAKAFQAQTTVDKKAGTHVADSDNITVGQAAANWLDHVENDPVKTRERTTVDLYRSHVTHHINPLLGQTNLSKLTKPAIDRFVRALLDRPSARSNDQKISRATARKVVVSFKSLLRYARDCGYGFPPSAMAVKISTQGREERPLEVGMDFPTTDEIRATIDAATGRWRPLIVTAAFTGMRSSELRGLRWDNVDFEKKVISVRERADAYNTIGAPKSKSGYRDIPMVEPVRNVLRQWRLECPHGELDLVFPNGAGNVETHVNILHRGFHPAQVAADVVDRAGKAKYGLHALRHWYASWSINRKSSGGLELDAKTVQSRLGHANVGITLNTYGHLWPESEDHIEEMSAAALSIVG
jgi:integrase